jgi:hypothetical protein
VSFRSSEGKGRRPGRAVGLFIAAAPTILAVAAIAAAASATSRPVGYRDGPPAGFSGGFGEDTCFACHFSGDLDGPHGSLGLSGLPASYEAGRVYPIVLTLTREDLVVGGFELTSRFEDGAAQAGELTVAPEQEGRVDVTTDRDIQYAHQRSAGSAETSPDSIRWTVLWRAPATGGRVLFHAAANAADGNGSADGDYVFTANGGSNPD